MPQIHVSEDTYNRLQTIARPFDEPTPEHVIRRLLSQTGAGVASQNGSTEAARPIRQRGLRTKYGIIPVGLKLKFPYKGAEYEAEIAEGSVLFAGSRYKSLSAAAVAVIRYAGTDRPTESGYRVWSYYDPTKRQWRSARYLKDGKVLERLREALSETAQKTAA